MAGSAGAGGAMAGAGGAVAGGAMAGRAGAGDAAPRAADAFSGGAAREPGEDSDGYAQDAAYQGDAMLYTCPSCGAEIVTDATTAATFCYYCHNPVVLSGRLTGTYQPDFAIPFQIDRKRAQEVFPILAVQLQGRRVGAGTGDQAAGLDGGKSALYGN